MLPDSEGGGCRDMTMGGMTCVGNGSHASPLSNALVAATESRRGESLGVAEPLRVRGGSRM